MTQLDSTQFNMSHGSAGQDRMTTGQAARQTVGGATGWPRGLLKIEGLAVLALCVGLYWSLGASWWLFAGLFLIPDLSFAAYWLDQRLGALAYNATHTEIGPILLGALGLTLAPACLPVALIWGGHGGGTGCWDTG